MIYANSAPVQNSLEQYIPLPMQQIWQAGQAIQERGDKAQQAADQVQIGLASMEANLPGHRQFVNKFANDYKQKASDLLDKYGNNTSDPNFIRESRQLGLQFAADPRLKTIQLANQEYQQKQKIKDTLNAEGKKYIDTNPYATGVDENGNLNANVGDLRMTNFDENIDKSFRNLENATEQVNGVITNKRNLLNKLHSYINSFDTNPDIQQGLAYYKQQGYSDTQAKQAMLDHLNAGLSYGKDLKDHFYEQMAWDKYKFGEQQKLQLAKIAAKNQASIVQPGDIAATSSPILGENLGKTKLEIVDKVLGNLNDAGGIKKEGFQVPDTEANRAKYKGKFKPGEVNLGASSYKFLDIDRNVYNKEEAGLVDEARDVLGDKAKTKNGYLSDKHILTKYREALDNSKSDAFNYSLPINQKYSAALTEQYFGKNLESLGNDYLVITNKGKFKAGTKEASEALANLDHVKFMGVNAAPIDSYPNGTIAAQGTTKSKTNGVNDPKNNIMIIKPMDNNMASQYSLSNKASTALLSPYNNTELLNNKSLRIVDKNNGVEYVPQKGLTNDDKIGVTYYPLINGQLDKSNPVNINSIQQTEHSKFFSRLGQSIGTKPEAQNYSDYLDE